MRIVLYLTFLLASTTFAAPIQTGHADISKGSLNELQGAVKEGGVRAGIARVLDDLLLESDFVGRVSFIRSERVKQKTPKIRKRFWGNNEVFLTICRVDEVIVGDPEMSEICLASPQMDSDILKFGDSALVFAKPASVLSTWASKGTMAGLDRAWGRDGTILQGVAGGLWSTAGTITIIPGNLSEKSQVLTPSAPSETIDLLLKLRVAAVFPRVTAAILRDEASTWRYCNIGPEGLWSTAHEEGELSEQAWGRLRDAVTGDSFFKCPGDIGSSLAQGARVLSIQLRSARGKWTVRLWSDVQPEEHASKALFTRIWNLIPGSDRPLIESLR